MNGDVLASAESVITVTMGAGSEPALALAQWSRLHHW